MEVNPPPPHIRPNSSHSTPGDGAMTVPVSGTLGEAAMIVLKRRDFSRWQYSEKLPDAALCKAVEELRCGLFDVDLGGQLFKKRIGRAGCGKSGGYRTLISARIGQRYVFLHGYAKNERANITPEERKAMQFAGKALLNLEALDLAKALRCGILLEVRCD